MGQRQIDAAFRRSLKTVYKHLSPPQYRLVKAQEQFDQHEKDMAVIERSMIFRYTHDWRRRPEARQDEDYNLFYWLLNDMDKLDDRITRLENKYDLDREVVMRYHNRMNQAHSASMVGASSF